MDRPSASRMFPALLAAAFAALHSSGEVAARLELAGSIDTEQAVAAAIPPALYFSTSRRADAMKSELRVLDGAGKPVPYVIRPSMARTVQTDADWHPLAIRSATETNGELVVEAEWTAKDEPQRFVGLKVSTRLADFDERVRVYAGDSLVGEGPICDRRRFADVRKDVVPVETAFARKFRLVFSEPVSEVEDAHYERTVAENASGETSGTQTRRGVAERSFRIDAISIAVPKEVVKFEPAKPYRASMAVNPSVDGKAKKTVFEFGAGFMPVRGVSFSVKDSNFSRMATVLRRADTGGGWEVVASGRITSIDLPGEQKRELAIDFQREIREEALRIEVDDMDNPRLEYGGLPVELSVAAYDAVFLAKPGEPYSLAIEKGAEAPRYDAHLLDYLLKSRDIERLEPVGWDPGHADIIGGIDAPAAIWITNPVPVVSVVAFIVLGALCLLLFRSQKRP